MDYTWEISRSFSRDVTNDYGDSLENSIIKVKWKRIVTDSEGNKADYLGTTFFDLSETTSDSFVDFNSVTKDTLLSWVQNRIDATELNKIDSIIRKKLLDSRSSVQEWS